MTRGLLNLGLCAFAFAGAGCSSQTGSLATRYGTILLESDSTAEPLQLATGFFYHLDSTPVASKCTVDEEQGACQLWRCDDYSPESVGEISPLSVGTVSATGARVALALEEREPGSYAWDNTLKAPLWGGGERLLAAVGGSEEFPAAAVSLTAPDPVTVTAPAVPVDEWRLHSGADLGFAWSGAVGSDLYVTISVAVPSADGGPDVLFPGLDCGFLGTAGASVVPASLLSRVPKPAGIAGHRIEALTFAVDAVRVDDALLTFRATSFAFSALATLE